MENNYIIEASGIKKSVLYTFFLLHSLIFMLGIFVIFYKKQEFSNGFAAGAFYIITYLYFYITIFGIDEIRKLFINSIIGVMWILSWLEFASSFFIDGSGIFKNFSEFPYYLHIMPGLYFIFFSFILRQIITDSLGARGSDLKINMATILFYAASVFILIVPQLL